MTPDFTAQIKPGRPVRIRAGAVVCSENPKRTKVTVKRPYWVKPFEATFGQYGEIKWTGSAGYACRTLAANVDAVEDLS